MCRPSRRVHLFGPVLLLAIFCQPGASQYGPMRQSTYPVFNSPGVRVDPGRYLTFPFWVRADLRRAYLTGNLQAQGWIRVLIYKDQRLIYDSGQRRRLVLNLQLLEPGNYALVLSNNFPISGPKVVWGFVNLLCEEGEDRVEAERQPAVDRYRVAQEVLTRLYHALQTVEREEGTKRLPSPPRLSISSEGRINGSAAIGSDSVWINWESFEVADTLGGGKLDALAGVLGHELAHLYLRHSTGGRNSSLWDELMGSSTLGRTQEQEADRLGVRLACLAGFNPEGTSLWMRSVIERYGASGLRPTHAQADDRIASFEQEARTCPDLRASNPPTTQGAPSPEVNPALPRKSIEEMLESETETEAEGRPKMQRKGQEATAKSEANSEPGERPKLLRRNQETATESKSTRTDPEGPPKLRHKRPETIPETTATSDAGDQSQATSSNPSKSSHGTAPLRIISKEQPEYTEEARRRGIKGTVILSAVFTLDGQVTDIRVIRSLPYGLTEQAIEAAKRIRFEPAIRDGEPMSIRTKIEFDFKP